MPYDFVTVSFSLNAIGEGLPSGTITFEPSDFILDSVTESIVIVDPIVLGYSGGAIPDAVTRDFLAMDSNSIAPGWTWVMTAHMGGRVAPLPRRSFTINIANGQQQAFAALAATSTVIT